MQAVAKSRLELGKRTRYYQAMMDHSLLAKNTPYAKLRKSYIIFLCTFDPYEKGRSLYTFSNICREDRETELCDDTTKIFFNAAGDGMGLTEDQANIMIFINGGPPKDDFTREMASAVDEYHQNSEKRAIYMTYAQELMASRAEGRAEGKVEGIVASIRSLMKNMNLPAEKAMTVLGIAPVDFGKYLPLL